jgi:hypothetical protein
VLEFELEPPEFETAIAIATAPPVQPANSARFVRTTKRAR